MGASKIWTIVGKYLHPQREKSLMLLPSPTARAGSAAAFSEEAFNVSLKDAPAGDGGGGGGASAASRGTSV